MNVGKTSSEINFIIPLYFNFSLSLQMKHWNEIEFYKLMSIYFRIL